MGSCHPPRMHATGVLLDHARAAAVLAALLVFLAIAAEARAQSPGATSVEPGGGHYGLNLAMIDAATIGSSVALGLIIQEDSLLWYLPWVTSALIAPGVHVLHDNATGAMLSACLRSSFPLLGGLLGAAVADSEYWVPDEAVIGAGIGAATALAIDWLVLARGSDGAFGRLLTATVAPTHDGVSFGLFGTF